MHGNRCDRTRAIGMPDTETRHPRRVTRSSLVRTALCIGSVPIGIERFADVAVAFDGHKHVEVASATE